MARQAPRHRVDGKAHGLALGPQLTRQFADRLLRLRHRHPIARNDDDAVRLIQRCRHTVGVDGNLLAGDFHRRARGAAKAAQDHRDKAAVHRLTHDVRQDRTRRAHQRANHDQQVIRQRKANRRRRPAGVAVQHRHDDGHISPANAHDQVIADEEGGNRHGDQRPSASPVKVHHHQDQRQGRSACVQHMTARKLGRLAVHLACQFAIGNHRPGEGHRTNEHAKEGFNLQNGDFRGRFLGDLKGKTRQGCQCIGVTRRLQRSNARHLDLGVIADEHRRQTHKRVHRGHQLRHFRHLHALSNNPANRAADGNHHQGNQPVAIARSHKRGRHGQSHARNAIPNRALGAFLSRQAAQRLNRQNCRNHIGRRGKSVFHFGPLTTFGTWRACAG